MQRPTTAIARCCVTIATLTLFSGCLSLPEELDDVRRSLSDPGYRGSTDNWALAAVFHEVDHQRPATSAGDIKPYLKDPAAVDSYQLRFLRIQPNRVKVEASKGSVVKVIKTFTAPLPVSEKRLGESVTLMKRDLAEIGSVMAASYRSKGRWPGNEGSLKRVLRSAGRKEIEGRIGEVKLTPAGDSCEVSFRWEWQEFAHKVSFTVDGIDPAAGGAGGGR